MDDRESGFTLSEVENPLGVPCANCGMTLTGPFCAHCGQHVADYHRSVWRFMTDFLDNTFCWDNKLLRTLGPLFRRPGTLTLEFMAGRRMRYVHPLRLFLFASAVCLALLHLGSSARVSFGSDKHSRRTRTSKALPAKPSSSPAKARITEPDADDDDDEEKPDTPAASPAPPSRTDPTITTVKPAPSVTVPTPAPDASPSAPSEATAKPAPTAPAAPSSESPPIDRAGVKAAVRDALRGKLNDKNAASLTDLGDRISSTVEKSVASGGAQRLAKEITDGVWNRLSWVVLGIMPVFALMLRGLYWRKDSYYFLHLVFSLHYHTFLLIFWTAYTWASALLAHSFFSFVVTLALASPPVYLFLSMRRVYGDSVRRTWTKVAMLGGMHLLAIFAALALIGGLSLFSAVG